MNSRSLYHQIHDKMPPRRARRSHAGYRGPARSARYRAWIRTLPCAACGTIEDIEAAHTGSDGGMRQKASDYSCIPLCFDCHTKAPHSYHRLGKREFERLWHIDCARVVARLSELWRLAREEAA